jgi:hypothetical protein
MIPLLLTLAACGNSDTSFGNGDKTVTTPDGDATMELSATYLTWLELVVGFSNSQDLTITSVGTGDLLISEAKVVANPDSAFFFDEIEDVTIGPGESVTWPVAADLHEGWDLSTYATGTLRVKSNDVECVSALLPLVAYPEGFTGDPGNSDDTAADVCQ